MTQLSGHRPDKLHFVRSQFARPRRPGREVASMASIRVRASSARRTGVLPRLCECFGPRTAWAGFVGMTWPTTIQSKSIRKAASRSFTVGLEWSLSCVSTNAATWIGSTSMEPVARAINNGKMDGFAQAYYDESGIDVAGRIMQYHTAANVPVYDALVRDFAISHRWFASFPGPTFCNRFHELTGFLNIDADGLWESNNSSPKRAVFTANIFDYLTQHGVSWKYFEHHYSFLRFFQNYTFETTNIVDYDDPEFGFENLARTGNLPSVTFIDPHFIVNDRRL